MITEAFIEVIYYDANNLVETELITAVISSVIKNKQFKMRAFYKIPNINSKITELN